MRHRSLAPRWRGRAGASPTSEPTRGERRGWDGMVKAHLLCAGAAYQPSASTGDLSGASPGLLPRGVKRLSLSWASLTLETVQSYEFLKHSICLASRGRELSLQPAPQPGAPAAWLLPTSQKTLCLLQAPMPQGVVLTASGTATPGRAHHDNRGEGGRLSPPARPGRHEAAGESERKPLVRGRTTCK